jgi:2-polyprenyl-3-methyl-5-hydroxy-6-metoxy-1,4-benzoquinol methylase
VLDVGAGPCTVTAEMVRLGHDVVAFDRSEHVTRAASEVGAQACVGDLNATLPDLGVFDVVLLMDVIEHLMNPIPVLKWIASSLGPNGRLVITCPNNGSLRARFYYLLRGQPMRTEGDRVPLWHFHHIRYFNHRALEECLRSVGMVPEIVSGTSEIRGFGTTAALMPRLFADTVFCVFKPRG